MSIQENIAQIKATIPESVQLIAVSKTKPLDQIMEAYGTGQRDFGENYIQELTDKQSKLPPDIRWHAIGHLQTNKVKYIASFVHLVHGVDSLKLLQELNHQAERNKRCINCLLQIYIAREESKFGFSFEECNELLANETLKKLKQIQVIGFMGMATNTDNTAQIRSEFRSLKNYFDICAKIDPALNTLSMGMSSDYKIAIEEGSTMIRIGSTIFGMRSYTDPKNG